MRFLTQLNSTSTSQMTKKTDLKVKKQRYERNSCPTPSQVKNP